MRLQEALDLNRSLAVACCLKEELSQLWLQSTKDGAAEFLTDWCRRVRASGISVLKTIANTLEGYCTGILSWYDYPISRCPLEGINNKIGAMQRMVYGYKDKHCFIANLYALHLAKFALIGQSTDDPRNSFRVEPVLVWAGQVAVVPVLRQHRSLCDGSDSLRL